jgi:hypothetical protein
MAMMQQRSIFTRAALLCLLALSGCATWFAPPVTPGQPEQSVIARLGQPAASIPDGNTHLLNYPGGSFGQYAYMARIGPDGLLISYTQVWTLQNFQAIRIGQDSKDDVLRRVGLPTEVKQYARIPYEAWNYGFKESGVWNSQMSVYFDDQGIVNNVQGGPDPRFENGDSRK